MTTRSGYIDMEFPEGGEHVGGGASSVSDSWMRYGHTGKIALDNWYPDEVRVKIDAAIQAKIDEDEGNGEDIQIDESVPDKHQKKIAIDTVKNPNKSLMGGPTKAEAIKILKTKFGYTDEQIKKLEESVQQLKESELGDVPEGIKMFATNNDTDKWLVAIDGHFDLYPSKELAEEVYNSIDSIEDSPHGSIMILPSSYASPKRVKDDIAVVKVSDYIDQKEDLLAYMKFKREESQKRLDEPDDKSGRFFDLPDVLEKSDISVQTPGLGVIESLIEATQKVSKEFLK